MAGKKPSARKSARISQSYSDPVAVVDIGSTSVRMVIAQIDDHGRMHVIESLQQEVSLGRDSFSKGFISKSSITQCVSALRSFRRVLREYRITREAQIRAVATSALREAMNRDAVLDRISIATGFDIDTLEDSEVTQFTYLGIKPYLAAERSLRNADVLIVEVGGGSTEALMVRRGRLVAAQAFRLGSFRMRETLEESGASGAGLIKAMENHVTRTVEQIRDLAGAPSGITLLTMGGDARFAAMNLVPSWDKVSLVKIPVAALAKFTATITAMSIDDIVREYALSYPAAETLGCALLAYVRLARQFKLKEVLVTCVTMRDGVLAETAEGHSWITESREQIVRSAVELGRKYHFDERHALHVARLGTHLFGTMQDDHGLGPRHELILHVAAILHDIGFFVSTRGHHKHSYYLVSNSEVFGLGSKDMLLAALVARYHRKAAPLPSHEGYAMLDRENRIVVLKLAAILRVADSLDRSHSQRVEITAAAVTDETLVISIPAVSDLTIEQVALRQKGGMMEQVYGYEVKLRVMQ